MDGPGWELLQVCDNFVGDFWLQKAGGVFWEPSVDAGPTMKDRGTNGKIFGVYQRWRLCSKA